MKLVIHPPLDEPRLAAVVAAAAGATVVNAATLDEALREIADADGFLGKLTPQLLAASRQLRWAQSFTASLEHYIFPELVAHPLTLTNMRGLYSDVIADHVMGYVICFARNLHVYIRQQAQGQWSPCGGEAERSNFAAGPGTVSGIDRAHRHLCDTTLGIVGLGQIGREVACRAAAFAMRVVAVDIDTTTRPAEVSELWPAAELPRLLAASDFVVICAPHTPDTTKLFRREQFQQMRTSACLVNIGRGAIVDLADLTAALQAGEIAGAALDVFETEPLPAAHPLWRMEKVIITPHVAGYGGHVAERHLAVLVENVGRFRRGEPLTNIVDKARWC